MLPFNIIYNQSRGVWRKLGLSLPPLPHTGLSWTLPVCLLCRHTPRLHISQSLFKARDNNEVYFLCFLRENWAAGRGESHRLKVLITFCCFYFPAVTKQVIKSAGKEKECMWTTMIYWWSPRSATERTTQGRRRGKISVNLLKLVWEFEEGGKRERGRDRQGEEQLQLKPGINIFQVLHDC